MALSKEHTQDLKSAAITLRDAAIIRAAQAPDAGSARKIVRVPTEQFGEVTINISARDPSFPVRISYPAELPSMIRSIHGKEYLLIDNGGVLVSTFQDEANRGRPIDVEPPVQFDIEGLTHALNIQEQTH